MRLLYPGALFFLFFIPVIIAMYILKQKFEEREISSTYLWEQVIKDMDVNTPWQKLKSSLPLILQVLAAAFLAFALTEPFWLGGKGGAQNVILVIDNTGSMNASYENTTRLEEAKNRSEKLIKGLKPGSKMTLISAGKSSKVELSSSQDKEAVLNKLKGIKPSNTYGDIGESTSLVKSLGKQFGSYKAVFFTDRKIEIKDIEGEVQSLDSYSENVSLDYISHAEEEGKLQAIVRVNNRSNITQNREISLYTEEKLFTLKDVQLGPKEVKTIYFDKIPSTVKYLQAEISEKDSLMEDNKIYDIIKNTEARKVLLVSQKNVFIEKVLSSLKNIEVFKTNSIDNIMDSYDLYIFDGVSPQVLPESGAVLFLNPPDNNPLVKVAGEVEGGLAAVQKSSVTKYMESASFTVARFKSMEVPYWASGFLKINNKAAAFTGDYKGRKTAVIGFDLHNSDFPLISEFPIFIHNLVTYLVDGDFQGTSAYVCGDSIDINPKGEALSLSMKTPQGKEESIELKYPIKPFENTEEIGIYKLSEKLKEQSYESLIAVNFPADRESGTDAEVRSVSNKLNGSLMDSSGVNLKLFLLIAILILLLIEWVVYIYGY
jgi:hypothetical protein